jgi:hypothetical protein
MIKPMTPLTIALISFLGGSMVTGGAILAINKSKQEPQDIEKIISSLETQFEQAQASAVANLTETDLLKVPCSTDYINGVFKDGKQIVKGNGDLLCREMFCRMNRQGGGQNSGGGGGATAQECSSISDASISLLMAQTCMVYWSDGAGGDQNSQYLRCIDIFDDSK